MRCFSWVEVILIVLTLMLDFSLIDAGKNPNLHMKNFVERTAAENQYTNAILSGTKVVYIL